MKRYRIVLIFIEQIGSEAWDNWEALGIGYLASMLRQRENYVEIVKIPSIIKDCHVNEILDKKPDVVGFTLPCAFEERFKQLGSKLKEQNPQLHITCGNRYATDNANYLLTSNSWLDSVIRGEGEYTIVELVETLEEDGSLSGVLGVHYKENGKIIQNPDRPLPENLDLLPFPARDMIKDMKGEKHAWLITARGCVNKCSFCNSSFKGIQRGKVWRGRSPENIVDEMKYVINETGCTNFFIVDSSYESPGNFGKKRIQEIASEILKSNIDVNYGVYFCANTWNDNDLPLLELLRKSGLEYAFIGIEAGTEKGIELYNKKATIEDNYRILDLFRRAQLGTKVGFILWHPYLSYDELKENIEFLYKSNIGYSFRNYACMLYPYKGTAIYEQIKKDGLLIGDYDTELGHYNWKFADERLEPLKNFLCDFLDHTACFMKAASLEYKILSLINRTTNYLLRHELSTELIDRFREQVDLIYKQLNEQNHKFILSIISCFELNKSEGELSSIKKEMIMKTTELVDTLEKEEMLYIKRSIRANLIRERINVN
ncbi:radical SAM protein [Paenibacillus sp. FSL K6-1096]|uniref:B12-binding domain-containing radical SAM protein n=1 Tax=Paenibacillus sp. FSL K6-1096 TaxID=2921460 RepID=UPI0030EDB320